MLVLAVRDSTARIAAKSSGLVGDGLEYATYQLQLPSTYAIHPADRLSSFVSVA